MRTRGNMRKKEKEGGKKLSREGVDSQEDQSNSNHHAKVGPKKIILAGANDHSKYGKSIKCWSFKRGEVKRTQVKYIESEGPENKDS